MFGLMPTECKELEENNFIIDFETYKIGITKYDNHPLSPSLPRRGSQVGRDFFMRKAVEVNPLKVTTVAVSPWKSF